MSSMPDLAEISVIRDRLCAVASRLEADALYPHDAMNLVGVLRSIINTASAMEASVAERVAQGRAWERNGARRPEDWLAGATGTSPGEAREAIETARRRKTQPALDAASKQGEVSPQQAAAVGKAAQANPAKEDELVGKAKAKKGTLRDLREECERVKAEAETDPDGAHRRRRSARHLRKRTCDDGSTEVIHHSTADETAEIWAGCEAVAQRLFLEERRRGIRRPHGQRMADALLILMRIARGELDPRAADEPTATDARPPEAQPTGGTCGQEAGSTSPSASVGADPAPAPAGGDTAPEPTGGGPASAPADGDPGPASVDGGPAASPTGGDRETSPRVGGSDPAPTGAGRARERLAAAHPPDALPLFGLSRPPDRPPDPDRPRPPLIPTGTDHTDAEPDLTDLARAALGRGLDTKILIRVDHAALTRGGIADDEVCEIAGVGPVPVSHVRSLIEAGDPFIATLVTKGVDVTTVAHAGRRANAVQTTALDWAQPGCSNETCDNTVGLEVDHRHDYAHTRTTFLPWLDRLCSADHDKKTRLGWALVHGTGRRAFVAPGDVRHPGQVEPDRQKVSCDSSSGTRLTV